MKKGNTKSLLSQWKDGQKETSLKTISKMPENQPMVLSHMQRRLWFLQQLHKGNPFYNYADVYRLNGLLEITHLQNALQLIYVSHDVLRSTYVLEDEQPRVRISPVEKLDILKYDLSESSKTSNEKDIHTILNSDANKAFDLEKGPLIRVSLLRLSETEHILLLTLHHIITDKWSMGLLRQQLAKYYKALTDGQDVEPIRTAVQYHDYAYWLNNQEISDEKVDYWKKKLSGHVPFLDLPKDFPSPIGPSYKGAFNVQPFSANLSKEVLKLSSDLETTPYVLLLSVFFVLLYRYSGQTDILIGSPISNRDQKVLEGIIGFFNDTVVLRTELHPDMPFKNLVKVVRKTTMEAFENKEVPFDILVKTLNPQRSLSVNPFFQTMFLYHAVPPAPNFGSDLDLTHAPYDAKVAKFDLTLYITKENESLTAIFEYATDIFSEATILRFHEFFKLLLEEVTRDPDRPISKLEMLTAEEKTNFTKSSVDSFKKVDSFKGIHEIIADVAKENPDKTALVFGNDSISYDEMNRKAEAIAHDILEKADHGNKVIGLFIDRSMEMVIGLLGILKAGHAYLPLDPDYPMERIKFMLNDSGATLVLAKESDLDVIKDFGIKAITIASNSQELLVHEKQLPFSAPNDMAYVIYTSGSTGRPKGVPISHVNIVNSTRGRDDFYDDHPRVFLLMSSITFDSSKAGIFWTLCNGGTLVITEKGLEQDIDHLAATIDENNVSHTLMLPSLYGLILEHAELERLKSLAIVIVAGESCPPALVEHHFKVLKEVSLYNEYGPTEATVWCIAHKITTDDLGGPVPIGQPVAGARVYILNDRMEQVPYGAIGELYIGGKGLTEGYLNLPDETSKRFVDFRTADNRFQRIYKTGDLVRYGNGGFIEFLGRRDQQHKIRGFRIELEEVEKTIMDHTFVDRVVVTVESDRADLGSLDLENIDTTDLLDTLKELVGLNEIDELLKSIEKIGTREQDYLAENL